MSHSVKVTLIADQEISIGSELVNVHDIRAIVVNGVGAITQVHKHSKDEESPADSPALPVQHGQHAICAMRFDTCCYSVDNVCSTGCSYGGVCPHKQHA